MTPSPLSSASVQTVAASGNPQFPPGNVNITSGAAGQEFQARRLGGAALLAHDDLSVGFSPEGQLLTGALFC